MSSGKPRDIAIGSDRLIIRITTEPVPHLLTGGVYKFHFAGHGMVI